MSTTQTIGQRIRARRKAAGLTQGDVARKLGVPLNTLARWERGEMEPKGLYLVAVERWLRKGGDDGR
jgi:transcriptional regulator with XRE-family HTH domain